MTFIPVLLSAIALEASTNFVSRTDPGTGVVSWFIRPGAVAESHQSLYFTAKSMTDDGRFLLFWTAENEFKPSFDRMHARRGTFVLDLETDVFKETPIPGGQIPFVDVQTDQVWYFNRGTGNGGIKAANDGDFWVCRVDLLVDPTHEIRLCRVPEELLRGVKYIEYLSTHPTLTRDRKKMFIACHLDDRYEQGLINLETGAWESWGATPFYANHDQLNPSRDDLAMVAWEKCGRTQDAIDYKAKTGWYPRMWHVHPDGRREMQPSRTTNYATHECWTQDGKGFYWCSKGVWHQDLATGAQTNLVPVPASHANVAADMRQVTFDCPLVAKSFRGCPWNVWYWDVSTKCGVRIHSRNEAMPDADHRSCYHPDPHPQFVCKDRYIVSTVNSADGHMDVAVTPVAPLARRMSVHRQLGVLPEKCAPQMIGKKLCEHFLETPPDKHAPRGCERKYVEDRIPYTIVSLWINAMRFARATADFDLERRLIDAFDPFYDGGSKAHMQSKPFHVDLTVFGAIPLQIYLQTASSRALDLGLRYADTQWRMATDEEVHSMPKWVWGGPEQHLLPKRELQTLADAGYSPQTRFWIDDMYMITVLQSQAYLATGRRHYIERAAREACLYLDRMQLKSGDAAGLFYHAPDVPFVWGRGDGWMAAGMAMLLCQLPPDSPHYGKVLSGYRKMMAALLRFQRKDGLWSQLVNEPDIEWGETSCSAMFAYAFLCGLRNGNLEDGVYASAAKKAYLALCEKLDEYGNIKDVCIGTGKFNDRQYYLDRGRLVGDPHGQAALLWCVNELVSLGF